MKQRPTHSTCEMILILRRQLEKAYEQGCLSAMQELSRRMDDIQLRCWEAQTAKVS